MNIQIKPHRLTVTAYSGALLISASVLVLAVLTASLYALTEVPVNSTGVMLLSFLGLVGLVLLCATRITRLTLDRSTGRVVLTKWGIRRSTKIVRPLAALIAVDARVTQDFT